MNKRTIWFWIVGGLALLIAGLVVDRSGIFGQSSELYEDPQGRFTMQIDPSWERVETDGAYTRFKLPDPPIHVYVLVLEARTVDDAFAQALEFVGFDPGLLTGGASANFGDWQLYNQEDEAGLSYGLAGQVVGEDAYVLIVKPDRPGVRPDNATVMHALTSLRIAGKEEFVIESYADLEEFVRNQLNEYRGPGQEDLILQKGESFSTMGDFRVLPPWGGLFGTPSDVTHFLQMNMNGGRYGDKQILQPETVALMHEMQLSTNGSPLGFGLSWMSGADDLGQFHFHGGGGATIESMMRFYPDLDLGVVVMGNVNSYQADRIAEGLISAWMHEK